LVTGLKIEFFIMCLTGILWCCAVFTAKTQTLNPLTEVNSPYDEQHPVISPTGNLFFTRVFHPENQDGGRDPGDVWMAGILEDGIFQDPTRIGELSSSGFDLLIGF